MVGWLVWVRGGGVRVFSARPGVSVVLFSGNSGNVSMLVVGTYTYLWGKCEMNGNELIPKHLCVFC